MKNYFFLLILLATILGCSNNNIENDLSIEDTCPKYYSLSGKIKEGVRIINIEAYRLVCNPDIIVINRGEKIRLILTTLDNAEHGFRVEGLGIELNIQPEKETIYEFFAEKSGIYELNCYVPHVNDNKEITGWLVVK